MRFLKRRMDTLFVLGEFQSQIHVMLTTGVMSRALQLNLYHLLPIHANTSGWATTAIYPDRLAARHFATMQTHSTGHAASVLPMKST